MLKQAIISAQSDYCKYQKCFYGKCFYYFDLIIWNRSVSHIFPVSKLSQDNCLTNYMKSEIDIALKQFAYKDLCLSKVSAKSLIYVKDILNVSIIHFHVITKGFTLTYNRICKPDLRRWWWCIWGSIWARRWIGKASAKIV